MANESFCVIPTMRLSFMLTAMGYNSRSNSSSDYSTRARCPAPRAPSMSTRRKLPAGK